MVQPILVTGAAGFIGAHLCASFARAGQPVVGTDHLRADDPLRSLRRARVDALLGPGAVAFHDADLADMAACATLFERVRPSLVVHLAAKPGVRDSLRAPLDYVGPNLVGFVNVMEACRRSGCDRMIFASSSSVYGARNEAPFRESDRCDDPESFYAATKAANELLAIATARHQGLRMTAARFFTVYGPWGRPDMAYYSFARAILRGEPITLYADGQLMRDFTYVEDTVTALRRLAGREPAGPYEVFNVGHHRPVRVIDFLSTLEDVLGRRAIVHRAPMQPGDVPLTCADPSALTAAIGPLPETSLHDGLRQFVSWLTSWEPADWPASPSGEEVHPALV